MAIEPLGSAISFQSQTAQAITPVQKTSTENTDVSAKEDNNIVDNMTAAVKSTDEKNSQSDNQSGQNSQYSQNSSSKQIFENSGCFVQTGCLTDCFFHL